MLIPCPACRTEIFTVRQKNWASAYKPLKCAACGALAAPSWWTVLAVMPLPFIVIFALWFSLAYRSWWPIALTLVAAVVSGYAAFRFIPLASISPREVTVHRVLGVLLLGFVVGSVVLSILGYRVGL